MLKVYIHKTCPTSIKLLDFLKKMNKLDEADIIDVEKRPFLALSRGYIAMPVIEINDKLIDFGPIDFDHLKLEGKESLGVTPDGALQLVIRDVLDNVYLALATYLRGDISVILDYAPTMRKLENKLPKRLLDDLKAMIKQSSKNIFDSIKDKLMKVIAFNFIFELYLIHRKKLDIEYFERFYPIEVFAHWVLARSSVGRVGLLSNLVLDEELREKIKALRSLVREKWDKYWDRVLEIFGSLDF